MNQYQICGSQRFCTMEPAQISSHCSCCRKGRSVCACVFVCKSVCPTVHLPGAWHLLCASHLSMQQSEECRLFSLSSYVSAIYHTHTTLHSFRQDSPSSHQTSNSLHWFWSTRCHKSIFLQLGHYNSLLTSKFVRHHPNSLNDVCPVSLNCGRFLNVISEEPSPKEVTGELTQKARKWEIYR